MKLKIIKDYDHRVSPAIVQAYREGTEVTVPREIGAALLKAGVAREIKGKEG